MTSIFQCLCSMSISGAKTAHEKSILFARPPTARQSPPQHHMHISARAPSQPMDKAASLRAGTRLTLRHRMGATPRIISLSLTTHKVIIASLNIFHEIFKANQSRLKSQLLQHTPLAAHMAHHSSISHSTSPSLSAQTQGHRRALHLLEDICQIRPP